MNYDNHLQRAISQFGDLPQINPEWNSGEHCVILLRSNKLTYAQIQGWMGNPSKKWIRDVLLKWAPELIDTDCNRHKLDPKYTSAERCVMNLVKSLTTIEVDGEDWTIDENLIVTDAWEDKTPFKQFDERTQKVIILALKNGKQGN